MIGRLEVRLLALAQTAAVFLGGVYLMHRQPGGMAVVATAAGLATLVWGAYVRYCQRPRSRPEYRPTVSH